VSVGVGIGFNIGTPPPPLPYYTQPPAPFPNAMWTPGYWAWGLHVECRILGTASRFLRRH
jgi:hypothetical protein